MLLCLVNNDNESAETTSNRHFSFFFDHLLNFLRTMLCIGLASCSSQAAGMVLKLLNAPSRIFYLHVAPSLHRSRTSLHVCWRICGLTASRRTESFTYLLTHTTSRNPSGSVIAACYTVKMTNVLCVGFNDLPLRIIRRQLDTHVGSACTVYNGLLILVADAYCFWAYVMTFLT